MSDSKNGKQDVHHHHHHHYHHHHNHRKSRGNNTKKNETDQASKDLSKVFKIILGKNDTVAEGITVEIKNNNSNKFEFDACKETTEIDARIESIDDLISLGKLYTSPDFSQKNYSFNVKALHDMIPVLEELKMFVGMDACKERVIQQIIYFSQNLHESPEFPSEKSESVTATDLFASFSKKKSDSSKTYNSNETTIDSDNYDFLNTVIRGGPGVGKTMFAKILSRIYLCLGVTSKSTFKIIKRTDLIGEFLGHTAMKTQQAINEALGGVLFIDEAYSIGSNSKSGNGDSYSKECIDVLTQNLSEHKGNLICIIAGYGDQLEKNFFSLNPGLKRRFGFYYDLDDYTPEELSDIFISKINRMKGWKIQENTISWLRKEKLFFKNMKYFPFFGGDIDNLITRIKLFHSHRVFGKSVLLQKIIDKNDILGGFDTFKKEYNNVRDSERLRDEEESKKAIMNMYI